ncbi:hypothetical protein VTN31DRAFT_2086 [Thermomyces dupontii]|uniref:uncharacterized protein n=1 Tax=Talaromyces thermophilus TaxID=28565 RepID=UPI003744A7AC
MCSSETTDITVPLLRFQQSASSAMASWSPSTTPDTSSEEWSLPPTTTSAGARNGGDLCAIYVHAGAGYHSPQNQRAHLETCNDAAKVAMALLKSGASAVDAVEMALRLMEDREITNAGFGSNLTIDGKVECDATIVDHLGRSGAVGACPNVKNPISAARAVLEYQKEHLSLRRTPPNLLVGLGAAEFAYDRGVSLVKDDYLISQPARARWLRWRHELDVLRQKEQEDSSHFGDVESSDDDVRARVASLRVDSAESEPSKSVTTAEADSKVTSENAQRVDCSCLREVEQTDTLPGPSWKDPSRLDDALNPEPPCPKNSDERQAHDTGNEDSDNITDTVGAIAVDCQGRIAAGSSSGGIGMKSRGRIGPAALVGIGTAVIPVDPDDPDQVSVATVTSGTGEHIITTSAAATCASRIYRTSGGATNEPVMEEEVLKRVIEKDFMGHPGVKSSHCEAAIGVLAVKKTVDGIYFWFCHNTHSFAVAAMNSRDSKPVCVMSRRDRRGSTAQGGRAFMYPQ